MLTKEFLKKEIRKELAKRKYINFIDYCWVKNKKYSPFLKGIHTKKICERIDYVLDEYRNGRSTFTIIKVPPQHGKSDLISNYFPPRFLGEFPEKEILMVSHCARQAYKSSKFGRRLLISNKKFKDLYNISLAKDSRSVESWVLTNGLGKAQWFGILSGIAGNGADCLILDDFFSNRADADSEIIREKLWNEFCDGLVSRRHDPCIFFILATHWNLDDIIGRYEKKMQEDPKFPFAEVIKFPAQSKKYVNDYLFLEMYSKKFYETQKAIEGEFGWLSLYQQTPIRRGGNMFKIKGINIINTDDYN